MSLSIANRNAIKVMTSFKALASIGVAITSYEDSGADRHDRQPVLTHIFWGKSRKEAISYARSHTITDYFFSSTFSGEMKWRDDKLHLSYDYQIFDSQFKALAPLGIAITSYEGDSADSADRHQPSTPIITHIFWGKNLKEALSYAKSHSITDYFFSSTFAGRMKWRDGELQLSYDDLIFGLRLTGTSGMSPAPEHLSEKRLLSLERYVLKVNDLQDQLGFDYFIEEVNQGLEVRDEGHEEKLSSYALEVNTLQKKLGFDDLIASLLTELD